MQYRFKANTTYKNQAFARGQTYNLKDEVAIALGLKKMEVINNKNKNDKKGEENKKDEKKDLKSKDIVVDKKKEEDQKANNNQK